jgi:phytanoyl-CoA hydroxylase
MSIDTSFYIQNGYVVVKNLFTPEETASYRDHFMHLRENGTYPGDLLGVQLNDGQNDPLKRYPRMIHMHHWDALSKQWMLSPRLYEVLAVLLGKAPYAVQTMLYFKPPGARGQALHQDNYYLRVQPGTCMAAWMALDRCDEANGCMHMVPGSHTWQMLCTTKANTQDSFTDTTVELPTGIEAVPVIMEPGDVLFFNGAMVHGSLPNTTTDRFRRSLIAHYIEADTHKVAQWYSDALQMDGTPIHIEGGPLGGTCGTWVDRDGQQVLEMTGYDKVEDLEAK